MGVFAGGRRAHAWMSELKGVIALTVPGGPESASMKAHRGVRENGTSWRCLWAWLAPDSGPQL